MSIDHEDEITANGSFYERVPGSTEDEIKVHSPIVRFVSPDAIIKILGDDENLNSTTPDMGTFFYCYNPQVPELDKERYSDGSGEIGCFIVFPKEADEKSLYYQEPYGSAIDKNKQIELTVGKPGETEDAITPQEYLFIKADHWPIVRSCQSIEDATNSLARANIDIEKIKQDALETAKAYVEDASYITQSLIEFRHPIARSEEKLATLLYQFARFPKAKSIDDEFKRERCMLDAGNIVNMAYNPEIHRDYLKSMSPLGNLITASPEKVHEIAEYLRERDIQ